MPQRLIPALLAPLFARRPAAPLGTLVYDTLSDPPTTPLAGHTPYQAPPGAVWQAAAGNWAINAAHEAYLPANADNGHAVIDCGRADLTLTCELANAALNATTGRDSGIVFRWTSSANYLRAGFNQYANLFRVVKVAAGVTSVLAGAAFTPGTGWHSLQVTLQGENITTTVQGGPSLHVTESFNAAATRHGFGGRQLSADRARSFRAQAPGAPASPLPPPPNPAVLAEFDLASGLRRTIGGLPAQADGDLVAEWRDKSGHNRHAYTLLAGREAVYRTAEGGYVQFVRSRASALKIDPPPAISLASYAYALRFRLNPNDPLDANPKLFRISGSSSALDLTQLEWLEGAATLRCAHRWKVGETSSGVACDTQLVQDDGAWHTLFYQFSLASDTALCRVDGALVASASGLQPWTTLPYDSVIGAKEPGGADSCPVDIRHLIVLPRGDYTPAEIAAIEAAL